MFEFGPDTMERMVRAVERVRLRLLRSTAALEVAGIPYAVAGANAVATWVAMVVPGAVRNTPEVEILIRRPNLSLGTERFETIGFTRRQITGQILFQDQTSPSQRDVLRIWIAGESTKPESNFPLPDVTECITVRASHFKVLDLHPLVRMELSVHKTVNRLNVRDLIDVGLVDAAWPAKFPPELASRLQAILDDPDG